MRHEDALYGSFDVPNFMEPLVATPQVQRLKRISQDVVPAKALPWRPPNRFEHCMGVMRLGMEVLRVNPDLPVSPALFLSAALLHDAGNCPLSHLAEPFLRELTGKDGESFLSNIIAMTPAQDALREMGVSIEEVVAFVTGDAPPYSLVLNGSIDIDNLDNVNRYWHAVYGTQRFDGLRLASAFRFQNGGWTLHVDSQREDKRWQAAREAVYGIIYGNSHLAASMMLYRALAIAFERGEILHDFYFLDDERAIALLRTLNPMSAKLIGALLGYRLYPEVFTYQTAQPSERLKRYAQDWNARSKLADQVASKFHLDLADVCAYIGKGRDRRKISLPLISADGSRLLDTEEHPNIYRVRVYGARPLAKRREQLAEFLHKTIL
jgi:HD superfamily phosphohydrolase